MATESGKISILLLKEDVASIDECLNPKYSPPHSIRHPLKNTVEIEGEVFVIPSRGNPPEWLEFVNQGTEAECDGRNTHVSAALILRTSGRFFAIPFGMSGRYFVNDEKVVKDFGMKVTINSVNPDEVASVDATTHAEVSQFVRRQASRSTSISTYGVNDNRHVLKVVTGKVNDKEFAAKASGNEAAVLTMDKNHKLKFSEIAQKCDEALAAYQSQAYRQPGHFGFYDNMKIIKDKEEIKKLDDLLVAKLKDKDADNMHLCIPEAISDSDIQSIDYGFRTDEVIADLELEELIEQLELKAILPQITPDELRKRYVRLYGHTGELHRRFSYYRSLVCELEDGGKTYVLCDGEWREVSAQFAQIIEEAIAHLDTPIPNVTFPLYDNDHEGKEANYNQSLAIANIGFEVMDGTQIGASGTPSLNEPCDVISPTKHFIHVKRYKGGASSIAHLFDQASYASRALITDKGFRQALRDKLIEKERPDLAQTIPDADAGERSQYKVIFGIIAQKKTSVTQLPFLTKYALKMAVDDIQHGLGLSVGVRFINFA